MFGRPSPTDDLLASLREQVAYLRGELEKSREENRHLREELITIVDKRAMMELAYARTPPAPVDPTKSKVSMDALMPWQQQLEGGDHLDSPVGVTEDDLSEANAEARAAQREAEALGPEAS